MSKVLIINSSPVSEGLLRLLRSLEQRGYYFYLMTTQKELLSTIPKKKENKLERKIFLGPSLHCSRNVYLFIFLLPLLSFKQFLNLAYFKYKHGVREVICVNWNEKIVTCFVGRILRLRMLWMELPTVDYEDKPTLLIRLFRSCSRQITFIVFLKADKFKLTELGISFDRIKMIPPAVNTEDHGAQDDIFSTLARSDHYSKNRNVFTIGVVDLEHSPQVETLFGAIKRSLDIIPELRVTVIGEREEQEYLRWLAQKMEIDKLVWLVGEQKDLAKWMKNFDLFIGLDEHPDVSELETTLKAMSVGVPVIALRNKGYEEIIEENKSGTLVSMNDSEIMAQRIIKLYQDDELRNYLSVTARKRINSQYDRGKQLEEFERALE